VGKERYKKAVTSRRLGRAAMQSRSRAAFLDFQRLNPNVDLTFAKATAPILDPADASSDDGIQPVTRSARQLGRS